MPVVARHPEVRVVMRERQRRLGATGDVVTEGRDIGSVVAPEAEVKVFLVADESERARRRATERPGTDMEMLPICASETSETPRTRSPQPTQ